MDTAVRVRFAPSPTGHLHLGGVRTALFNWFFARHHGGKFILRIEDTDPSRSTDEFIHSVLEGLIWLGIDWDEGPYRQTERQEIYQDAIQQLLKAGQAYYCYCSPQELEERRQAALKRGEPPRYDGRCRLQQQPLRGREPAVRFLGCQEGNTVVEDLIHGPITFDNALLDDLILMRANGTPTYNLVVVVDDATMGITHVIRGDDHLANTPKQILLYRTLGYTPPQFAHLPMIMGADRGRLSKRHGATSILSYRDSGYLPQALVNYLMRLGWSWGDQEIFSREEIIDNFSLEHISKGAAAFNPDKLLWLNAHYMKETNPVVLSKLLIPFLHNEGVVQPEGDQRLPRMVSSLLERTRTLVEMAKACRYYFDMPIAYDAKAAARFFNPKVEALLREVKERLAELPSFDEPSLDALFQSVVAAHHLRLGDLAQPVRLALTGVTVSPGIFEVMAIMGRERVLQRLEQALHVIRSTIRPDHQV